MYLNDYHLHTSFSGDSVTPPSQVVEQAISLGMQSICFTDHHDEQVVSDLDFNLDFPAYWKEMKALQKEYQDQISIRIGVEMGLQRRIADVLKSLEQQWAFDFIIGSCHFIDGMDPYYPEYFDGRTEEESYRHYFEVLLERIKVMSCYDVLGHLDYIVRYGPNQNRSYSYEKYAEVLDEILKQVITKGKGLECNSGGLKYGLGEPNPSRSILKRYRELGGEIITIGSDAHEPAYVGYEFETCKKSLLECGFRYYTIFAERKPEFLTLEEEKR